MRDNIAICALTARTSMFYSGSNQKLHRLEPGTTKKSGTRFRALA